MKNMKKCILFFGAILAILAMICSTMALGATQTTQPTITTNSEPLATGGNSIHTVVYHWIDPYDCYWLPFEWVICKDLNTGIIRIANTGLLGTANFCLLPAHHNYLIYSNTEYGYGETTVKNLVGWKNANICVYG